MDAILDEHVLPTPQIAALSYLITIAINVSIVLNLIWLLFKC